ncbi:MAG TPA: YggS family pyridoxal phosphate-dependent enzyme [Nocardioidaceae bacterium]|nr:YggS family pyridoxal phosphate-dependent enzyme [Nocardioidaceae bacterium]
MKERAQEIADNLTVVRERVAAACADAGRGVNEVTLTVVTKFFPVSDIAILADLGIRDVGENRHQEAASKAAETHDLDLRWHFIGNLQSNKSAAVAAYADVVESVDRVKLIKGLDHGASVRGTSIDCLVQVNLDEEPAGSPGRGGAAPADIGALSEGLAAAPGLRLRGVMAVAPLGEDPVPAFERLGALAERVRRIDPAATWISAGMSEDLEAAIGSGATHVRIGSAVLGRRPTIK